MEGALPRSHPWLGSVPRQPPSLIRIGVHMILPRLQRAASSWGFLSPGWEVWSMENLRGEAQAGCRASASPRKVGPVSSPRPPGAAAGSPAVGGLRAEPGGQRSPRSAGLQLPACSSRPPSRGLQAKQAGHRASCVQTEAHDS